MTTNDTLSHYGIIGMKWGIRRTPEQLGHAPKEEQKAFRKQVRQDEKDYRKQRRAVAATQKNLKQRSQMLKRDEKKVEKAEKESRKALRKAQSILGNRDVKDARVRATDKALDRALERSEKGRAHEKQARKNATEAIKKMEQMVEEYNSKYGAENVKQLDRKTIKRGLIFGKTVLEDAVKTGMNATSLPVFGKILASNIVSNIERQDREALMEERLEDYDRKKYA